MIPPTPNAPSEQWTAFSMSVIPDRVSAEPATPTDRRLRALLGRAGQIALGHFGRVAVSRKGDGSPVTDADRAAEKALVEGLTEAFPDHAVRGEEGGHAGSPDQPTWVVDPIDGTAAFVEGLAYWGPTVALVEGGIVRCAATWLPRTADYWYFESGVGAFHNGQRMGHLGDPALTRSTVLYVPSRMHAAGPLIWPGKARCLGSIAAHLALVASGAAAAAVVAGGWAPWDTAAGLALIRETGGHARVLLPTSGGTRAFPALDLAAHGGLPFMAGTPTALDWLAGAHRLPEHASGSDEHSQTPNAHRGTDG